MVMALKNKVENENIKRLIPLGFIVDAGRKELEEVLHSFERSKYLSDALSLSIAVTNKCNLGCKFCYLRKAAPVSLSGDVATGIYNFADKMCQDRGYSKLFVTWSGGEPTIELPSIRKMTGHFLQYCEDHGMAYKANMVTNGSLLPDLDILKELRCGGIQISLEPTAELDAIMRPKLNSTDSYYHHVYANIKRLAGSIPITIRMVLGRRNRNSIAGFVRTLHRDGLLAKNVNFALGPLHVSDVCDADVFANLLDGNEYAEAYFNIYEELLDEGIINSVPYPSIHNECGAYKENTFSIDAAGNIFKCFEEVFGPEASIGKVSDGVIAPCRNHTSWCLADFEFRGTECASCNILPVCKGGCNMMHKFSRQSAIGKICSYGCNEWKYNIAKGIKLFYKAKQKGAAEAIVSCF